MELKSIVDKTKGFIKKYQYILLIIVIGFILLMIPSKVKVKEESKETVILQEEKSLDTQHALSAMLSKINGAGKVEVLLTFLTEEEYVYQTNENSSDSQETVSKQIDTVTVTDSGRNETGLVKKILAPTYRGAVVICEGADEPSVRLAIVDAVANATGLTTDRISVLKMK